MYLDFFSLKKFPFRITPDPSMFFPGGANGPGVVLNALVYAVTSGEGIVKVVGEVGSGKTMLCRMLEEKLPDNVEIVYLANPSLSARDIIYAIAFELDLDVDASTERLMVMHKLQDYLVRKHSEGGAVVVFIEEAQGMPLDTLEEIRLLSNLETHRHKLMQIILFGQPELDKNLQGKNIRQLRERITHSFYLQPMTEEQTSDYLRYRMQAAGCPWPQVFSSKAEKLLNKASEGLTRRVNILADKSLMAAYATSSIQPGHEYGAVQQKVMPQHVKAAIRDSGYGKRHLIPWKGLVASLALVVAASVAYFGLVLYRNMQPDGSLLAITEQQAEASTPAPVRQEDLQAEIPTPEEAASEQSGATEFEQNGELLALVVEEETVSATLDTEALNIDTVEAELPLGTAAEAENPTLPEAPEVLAENIAGTHAGGTPVELDPPAASAPVEALTLSEEPLPGEVDLIAEAGIDNVTEAETVSLESQTPVDVVETDPVPFSEVGGLVGIRARASLDWLEALGQQNNYTVQMASFPVNEQPVLEEYLQLLSLTEMIEETYLCLISGTSRLPPQWLVIHGEFSGVSRARSFIEELPAYSRQYEPFVRNSSSVACLDGMQTDNLLAF